MTSPAPKVQTCLRCNADLLPGDERCPHCGWVNHYRNQTQDWEYQQAPQWQPTTMESLASVEGVGEDESGGPLGRLYSWLLAPRQRTFTLATLAALVIIGVGAYIIIAQSGSKPQSDIVTALTSPTPAAPSSSGLAPTDGSSLGNTDNTLPGG